MERTNQSETVLTGNSTEIKGSSHSDSAAQSKQKEMRTAIVAAVATVVCVAALAAAIVIYSRTNQPTPVPRNAQPTVLVTNQVFTDEAEGSGDFESRDRVSMAAPKQTNKQTKPPAHFGAATPQVPTRLMTATQKEAKGASYLVPDNAQPARYDREKGLDATHHEYASLNTLTDATRTPSAVTLQDFSAYTRTPTKNDSNA